MNKGQISSNTQNKTETVNVALVCLPEHRSQDALEYAAMLQNLHTAIRKLANKMPHSQYTFVSYKRPTPCSNCN